MTKYRWIYVKCRHMHSTNLLSWHEYLHMHLLKINLVKTENDKESHFFVDQLRKILRRVPVLKYRTLQTFAVLADSVCMHDKLISMFAWHCACFHVINLDAMFRLKHTQYGFVIGPPRLIYVTRFPHFGVIKWNQTQHTSNFSCFSTTAWFETWRPEFLSHTWFS